MYFAKVLKKHIIFKISDLQRIYRSKIKPMKNFIFNTVVIMLACFSSCQETTNEQKNIAVEHIKVDVQEKYPVGNFEDYFTSSKIIPLETIENSLFAKIDRLSLHKDKIFILDRKSNAVLIFSNTGKFLNKIQDLGKGPGEYASLMDFTIDKDNERVILYTDRPYKLITYGMDGKFLKEDLINDLYLSIGYKDNKLLFRPIYTEKGKMFSTYDLETRKREDFIGTDEKDKFFSSLGSSAPNIISDKTIHVSLPYSEMIYEYDGNKFKPKYYIDFGRNKTPDNFFDNFKDLQGVFKYAKENKYVYGVSNFRESKDYITFSFQGANIAIYSKASKKTKVFSAMPNDDDRMAFYNYFAHDGDDNNLITVYPSDQFKMQMEIYKKNDDVWKKLPDYLKKIDENVSISSNPLLHVYTFIE